MNLHSNALVRSSFVIASSLAIAIIISSMPAQAIGEAAFCKGLTASASKISSGINSAREKVRTAQTEQAGKLKDLQAKWDTEVNENREKWDTKRQEQFTKLNGLAKTDEQKAAVTTYQQAITAAVTARRTANDAARADFRKGVESIVATKKTNTDAQLAIFNSAVSTAITTAEAACTADNPNVSAIRATLQNSIKSARETYTNARKADTTVGNQIKLLAQTRNDAIKANDAAFKKATEAARTELKNSFTGTNI